MVDLRYSKMGLRFKNKRIMEKKKEEIIGIVYSMDRYMYILSLNVVGLNSPVKKRFARMFIMEQDNLVCFKRST